MKLIYRGAVYDYDSSKATARRSFRRTYTSKSVYELIYRGSTYRVDPTVLTEVFVQSTEYELIYRGNTYLVNRNEKGEVAATVSSNRSKHSTLISHSTIQRTADEYSV
jgi:hypothetical protein